MKQSIGSTVSINLAMVFIVVVFAFFGAAISYYKAYKVNNAIAYSIIKYEGYNDLSKTEINRYLSSIGYNQSSIDCGVKSVNIGAQQGKKGVYPENSINENSVANGYCIYLNVNECVKDADGKNVYDKNFKKYSVEHIQYCKPEYYNYIVKTYLQFEIPIVHTMLRIPVYTKTDSIYACYGDNC